jgi:hypothetical protein
MHDVKFITTVPLCQILVALCTWLFCLGVGWFLLGVFITIAPGGEQYWFTIAGILLLPGLFLPRWSYRIAAVVLLGLCIFAAIGGHERAELYRNRPEQRKSAEARP